MPSCTNCRRRFLLYRAINFWHGSAKLVLLLHLKFCIQSIINKSPPRTHTYTRACDPMYANFNEGSFEECYSTIKWGKIFLKCMLSIIGEIYGVCVLKHSSHFDLFCDVKDCYSPLKGENYCTVITTTSEKWKNISTKNKHQKREKILYCARISFPSLLGL